MNNLQELISKNWSDAQIIELTYTQNDSLRLIIKDWREDRFTYEFTGVFKLSFASYLDEDISSIRYIACQEEGEHVGIVSIVSAWSEKEIASFSFLVDDMEKKGMPSD